jgi:hypothetical protein
VTHRIPAALRSPASTPGSRSPLAGQRLVTRATLAERRATWKLGRGSQVDRKRPTCRNAHHDSVAAASSCVGPMLDVSPHSEIVLARGGSSCRLGAHLDATRAARPSRDPKAPHHRRHRDHGVKRHGHKDRDCRFTQSEMGGESNWQRVAFGPWTPDSPANRALPG